MPGQFAIDAEGVRYRNGEVLSRDEAQRRFDVEGRRQPQPEVHLRADQEARYREIAETLADAARAGLGKVGFVSEPDRQ